MAQITLTFGVLPSRDQFDEAWDKLFEESAGNLFRITNCKLVGNAEFTCSELWDELHKATDDLHRGNDESGDWASAVLGQFGVEWV